MTKRRIYNKFRAEKMWGEQNYGNVLFVEEYDERYQCWNCVDGSERFVPCVTGFNPKTRNSMGDIGAYESYSNYGKVQEVTLELENEYL